ncbi:MAG: Notch domain-containing protein [Flavobacteriales bacterium]|nr:Notch domain-containing protein [Flavobacteriales bacterium]
MTNIFYVWWKNHRRVITFGGFLILLGLFFSPVIEEAKYKNTCIKLSEKGALNKFNVDDIGETLLKETGLTITELAKIEGYKNCAK